MKEKLKGLTWTREEPSDSYVLQIAKENRIDTVTGEIFARITSTDKNRLNAQIFQCFGRKAESDWFYLADFDKAKSYAETIIYSRASAFLADNFESVPAAPSKENKL